MDYTLHQLKVFRTVADYQSITKAAEALFLTQPAVSIQMRKLQDQFEIPLTEVVGRQLYVTDFGHQVLEICKTILDEVEHLQFLTDQHKGVVMGSLNFSVVSTAKYVIPYFIKIIRNKFQKLSINT